MTVNQVTFRDGPLVTATIDARRLQRHVDIKELQRVMQQQLTHMSNEKVMRREGCLQMKAEGKNFFAPTVRVRVELEVQSITAPYRESLWLDLSQQVSDLFSSPIDYGKGLTRQEEVWLCTPPEVRAALLSERERLTKTVAAQMAKGLFDLMAKRDTINGYPQQKT